jgi:ABC-type nitrate/sulfonate/bicarbonate transport system, ATPase component
MQQALKQIDSTPAAKAAPVPPRIEFRAVSKRYGSAGKADSVLAIDGLQLSIAPGEIVSVLGPTGCGKSSALNLIAGFETPSSGAVLVDSRPVTGPGLDRAVVFQQPALFPWLRVIDNVTLGLKCRGAKPADYLDRAHQLLARVGLAHAARRYPYQLSGGMRQRVQIARALLGQPDILLMDEPFGALDYQTRLAMQELLLDLWSEFRPTVLFITHDVGEAVFVADRVVVLGRPGRVKHEVTVPAPKPRDRSFLTKPLFVELQAQLLDAVQREARLGLVSQVPNA